MTFNTQINSREYRGGEAANRTYKAYRTHDLDEELLNYICCALFIYSGVSIFV